MSDLVRKDFLKICLPFLLSILLIGCSGLLATPIKKIIDNPRDYDGKSVKISGQVTEVFSLVLVKYFVVRDKTGEIAVVTSRPIPKPGAEITVKGMIKEAFSLGDKQLIVLIEKDQG